jgi:tetratricopeptide (TPR) repeat protein
MRGGVSTFVCLASRAATGCATSAQRADIKVRPLPDAADKLRPGAGLLADARAQLALGNVGLALEGFRKALREQPQSAEAYSGIAKAYEAMGRSDLARANYEAALALTPRDPQLLTAVAVALDEQGRADAAAMARQEAASVAAPAEPALPQPRSNLPATVALGSTITVQLPPARPAKLAALAPTVAVDLSAPTPAPTHVVEWSPLAPRTSATAPVSLSSSVTVQLPPARPTQLAGLAPRVAVDLSAPPPVVAPLPEWSPPAPRTAAEAPVSLGLKTAQLATPRLVDAIKLLASNVGADFSTPKPAPTRNVAPPAEAIEPGRGPFLERLSPAEVALVTDGQPVWHPRAVAQNRASTIVRWVPLMMADARPNVRILNAAQRQGLAAASRNVLLDRGWRKIAIGNAGSTVDRSVVLYPASRRTLARSLAAQFGIPARLQADANVLVVLLGRDAARRISPPKRG